MAKTITKADLLIKPDAMYVVATVEMPASEYAAFVALAGLTNSVPSHVTSFISARNAAGSKSGQ